MGEDGTPDGRAGAGFGGPSSGTGSPLGRQMAQSRGCSSPLVRQNHCRSFFSDRAASASYWYYTEIVHQGRLLHVALRYCGSRAVVSHKLRTHCDLCTSGPCNKFR